MIGATAKPRLAKSGKVPLLLVAAWVSVFAAACAGSQQAGGGSVAAEAKVEQEASTQDRARVAEATTGGTAEGNANDGPVARVGEAESHAGDAVARADNARARAGGAAREEDGGEAPERNAAGEDRPQEDRPRESHPQELTLKVGGEPGTGFSGACAVGEGEKTIEGRVPERYVFEPGDAGLECEIRKEGGGALEVVVAGEGVRSVQRTGAGEGTVRFAFSGGGMSSSTSSISLNQTVKSSDRSSPNDSR